VPELPGGDRAKGEAGPPAEVSQREMMKPRVPRKFRLVAGKIVREYRLVAEEALGRQLPEKAVVHHHTETSIVILENQHEHMQLERRRRVQLAGGDPWADAWCSRCRLVRPVGDFYRRKSDVLRPNGSIQIPAGTLTTVCRPCTISRCRAVQ
jgi:hypothetical protein